MAVAGIGIVVNGATALLFLRGRHDDLNVRGAFLHMAADAAVSAGVVVAGSAHARRFGWTWLDPVASLVIALVIVFGHVGLVSPVAAPHVRRRARRHRPRMRCARELEALPGVDRVHDLHVWATGTTEIALTAHLVMPEGHPDDRVLRGGEPSACEKRFAIGHVTLQVVSRPTMPPCDGPVAAADPTGTAGDR